MNLLESVQHGFALLYQSDTRSNKKLSERAIPGHILRLDSDESLYRVLIQDKEKFHCIGYQVLRLRSLGKLMSVSDLLDGLSRQHELKTGEILNFMQKKYRYRPSTPVRFPFNSQERSPKEYTNNFAYL